MTTIQLTVELGDFPDDLRVLAEAVGVPAAMKAVEMWGGARIYVHRKETILRRARNRLIRKEFTGANIPALARKYGLSPMMIRLIVAR